MKKFFKWPTKISSVFFYKRTVTGSLLFLLFALSFDCFFQKLPLSGYGLILITLLLITFTTYATCQGIKWAITSNRPLYFYINEKNKNENIVKLFVKCDDKLFKKACNIFKNCFSSFKQKAHLEEQIRLLLKDIEGDFVKTWYSNISLNPIFLFESHSILEEFFLKIIKKLKTCNHKNLISRILILYLNNLQEYKKSFKKVSRINSDSNVKNKVEFSDVCKFIHPGTQNDQILNYYFKKVSKVILKEFLPCEFSKSLECKILSGIIGRKIFRKLLTTFEDPTWINIKLIYLLNAKRHEELLQGKTYVVKEKIKTFEDGGFPLEKSSLLSGKMYMSPNLFERNGFGGESSNILNKNISLSRPDEKESLTLPLSAYKTEETKGNISTVLSSLISSTAGPLLPDNISFHYKALNKMWLSPVAEVKDVSESIANSFRKAFSSNGVKDEKGFGRSKSTESLCLPAETRSIAKDVSIGEELSESTALNTKDLFSESTPQSVKVSKKLTKTYSFDEESFSLEDKSEVAEVTSQPKGEETVLSVADYQRDVSPVYEEPEDFATTIAKLRCLLQQRESNSTLSEKSNPSVDSQFTDKSQSSNKSQSLEEDLSESQFASELPTDGRLFVNISIPEGELVTVSGSTHVLYTIQYDGVYVLKDEKNGEQGLVLQTTVVKRRFQDFLKLQMKLEENADFRAFLKGIKGPTKWLSQTMGVKPEECFSRKETLETFLREICSKVELSNSSYVHEFLAYGQSVSDVLVKKGLEPPLQRIDKLLANKVTGVFNSIRTALPSFDFDSPTFIATSDGVKSIQEQKLLQGFLNFGNKPEYFEIHLTFVANEQTGEQFVKDVKRFLHRKSDCLEHGVDALESSNWLSDENECKFLFTKETCVWESYKDVFLDDELEPLDSTLPICSLVIDILSELLQDSDCWVIKEPVIRLLKVVLGHWESKLEEEMSKWDWSRIVGNAIRLLRTTLFQSVPRESIDLTAEETKNVLKMVILDSMPGWATEFIDSKGLSSAVSLFVDSFQHFKFNRDVILRLFDIFLVYILPCDSNHVGNNCNKTDKTKSKTNQNNDEKK